MSTRCERPTASAGTTTEFGRTVVRQSVPLGHARRVLGRSQRHPAELGAERRENPPVGAHLVVAAFALEQVTRRRRRGRASPTAPESLADGHRERREVGADRVDASAADAAGGSRRPRPRARGSPTRRLSGNGSLRRRRSRQAASPTSRVAPARCSAGSRDDGADGRRIALGPARVLRSAGDGDDDEPDVVAPR